MSVITINNERVAREEAAYIRGAYYKIGDPNVKDSGDCYPMEEDDRSIQRYRMGTGKIEWDHVLNRYNFTDRMLKGITKDGTLGYFTSNNNTRAYYADDKGRVMMYPIIEYNEDIGYWCSNSGDFVVNNSNHPNKLISEHLNRVNRKQYNEFGSTQSGTYNLVDVSKRLRNKVGHTANKKKPLFAYAEECYNALNGRTLGLEIETSRGVVPEPWLFDYGFIPLRDGSVSGVEYTSIVINNLQRFNNIFHFLTKGKDFMSVNNNTSFHVHVGNFEFKNNQELMQYALSIYMLYYHLQTEFEDMVPLYKRDRRHQVRRDYCQPMRSLRLYYNNIKNDPETFEIEFNKIYQLYNDGLPMSPKSNLDTRTPYKDVAKYQHDGRYYSLNLFNLFFGNTYTTEFRIHHGTTNPDKVIAWTMICAALANFAKDNYENIVLNKRKYNLFEVIESVYGNSFITEYLNAYIDDRKQYFQDLYFRGDMQGNEFKADNTFKFKLNGRSLTDE